MRRSLAAAPAEAADRLQYAPCVGSDRDDELGRTATAHAPGSVSTSATPAAPVAATLGRYRIEKELGAGGMGVVHAAFDPDLERRVALKVLRSDDVGGEARQRLLREARAMARLAHPNVVTVHEVGSANGRDYVAMELVDGETLADWLRAEQRDPGEVIAAFVAAGRGLAAAHAAGIVHRDFKPHNVLRHRNGRIVVTDFGLARESHEVGASDPLAVTVPSKGKGSTAQSASSPLSGLTVTGSVLGTPAYMAPEQWNGGAVTPATDQFAYCVALWEALAGERPFRGPTVETLRAAVERGPDALDASEIPRRLRPVLQRGLDPDPKRRWPNMEALLSAMTKVHRPVVALAIASGAVVAAATIYVVAREGPAVVPIAASCPAPAIDPGRVSAGARPEQVHVTRELDAWRAAREQACKLDPVRRGPVLGCLDAVLARLDTVAAGLGALPKSAHQLDATQHAIAPSVCAREPLPRLVPASRQLREVLAAVIDEEAKPGETDEQLGAALLVRAGTDPCARAWAHVISAGTAQHPTERERHLTEAEQDAESCGDDRIVAEIALANARQALAQSFLGNAISAKIKRAATAVERVSQADLLAELDALRMETAQRADNLDEAIQRGEAAMAGYAARGRTSAQIRTGLDLLELLDVRAQPEDVARMKKWPLEWRTVAIEKLGASHRLVDRIDAHIAWHMFMAGDVAGAHARLERLRRSLPITKPRKIEGRVVDDSGKPVAGATVSAARGLTGGTASAVMAFNSADLRSTTTREDGTFTLPEAVEEGVIIAHHQHKRSLPAKIADKVDLVLAPTSRIEGKVDLRGVLHSKVIVSVQDQRLPFTTRYETLAPVGPDGTFSVDGIPRAKVRVFAVIRGASSRSLSSITVDVNAPSVKGIKLAVAVEARSVHVVVRSTVGAPVGNAQVFVSAGSLRSTTADKIDTMVENSSVMQGRQIELEKAPPAVVKLARSGDLFATARDVPSGAATACAVGLPHDLADATLDKKISANLAKIEVRCVPIPADADAVLVEVPPWPRLD